MNTAALKQILTEHRRWIESDGKGGTRADLQSADLQYANLRYADLRSADLRYADLQYADLQSANLQYADLRSANLRYADLQYADLQSANLQYADLQYANLRSADLQYADLRSADLTRCILCDAALHGAGISYRHKLVVIKFKEVPMTDQFPGKEVAEKMASDYTPPDADLADAAKTAMAGEHDPTGQAERIALLEAKEIYYVALINAGSRQVEANELAMLHVTSQCERLEATLSPMKYRAVKAETEARQCEARLEEVERQSDAWKFSAEENLKALGEAKEERNTEQLLRRKYEGQIRDVMDGWDGNVSFEDAVKGLEMNGESWKLKADETLTRLKAEKIKNATLQSDLAEFAEEFDATFVTGGSRDATFGHTWSWDAKEATAELIATRSHLQDIIDQASRDNGDEVAS